MYSRFATKRLREFQKSSYYPLINIFRAQVVVVDGSPSPVYTPAKHYTISSSGEVVVVEEAAVNHPADQLDLSCDETLPLPSLDESDGSSDIPISLQKDTSNSAAPLLNFELLSPGNQTSVSDTQIQHLLGLNGESASPMSSLSTLRQGFLVSSPTFMSFNTHIPTSSYHMYTPPVNVEAYEEISNDEIGEPNHPQGPIAA